MQEEQIREALNAHWHASAAGDVNAEHDIYDDDAICDYPQSGERIFGRSNLQALRSELSVEVISGSRNTQSPTRGDQHTQ